jgi:D-alanine-D-alanine ligase
MSAGRVTIGAAGDFGRVAVLLGGSSAEREVSLKSGRAVHAALVHRGVDAHAVDPREVGARGLIDGGSDRFWIALHGRGGEDGTVQGLLESVGLPYTGSGVLGCALAMDKLRSKQVFVGAGLPTPDFAVMTPASDASAVVARLGLPLFVKPASEGSSVGMTRVAKVEGLLPAVVEAARFDETVLVERLVAGGEYSATILAGEALPLIRIETPRAFYDYEAKYFADDTRYHCPCGLPAAQERELKTIALQAFEALAAAGWGRVDFMLDRAGKPQLLEVNTVPGMTDHSLVPMAARAAGIDFDELVWRVLETSFLPRGAYRERGDGGTG